eukprot:jgi/Tetstr1/462541/TSEL_007530.t2
MAAVSSREVTTKVIDGISFGFYNDDEIRNISVKRITSPIIFDNLKHAVPDGLYDSALGPIDNISLCSTCKLNHFQCPGHFGHIELAVPVYNPLVFNSLYKLLRCVCLHCFKLRMSTEQIQLYSVKLELLHQGRLVEGLNSPVVLEKKDAKDSKGGGSDDGESESEEEEQEEIDKATANGAVPPRRSKPIPQTSQTRAAIQATIADFFSHIPKERCANCAAISPGIRREGFCKIFKAALPMKKAIQNENQGTEIVNVLDSRVSDAARREAAAASNSRPQQDSSSSSSDGEDSEQGEEVEETSKKKKVKAKKGESVKAAAGREAPKRSQAVFMTVSEVKAIITRLWGQERDLLRHVYGDHGSHQMFFLGSVPVAPNRFRPVSHVGNQVFEHAQNVLLVKCISLNLDIVDLQQLPEAQPGITGPVADMGRVIRLWLELQDSVNTLFDSSTAEKASAAKGAVGIRQGLEKKEGLFRKNMMGKRVNFAARSVISPDPCIGTGEIGVPPYFAKRLSFPERVTPWNVTALREMVERGPDEHPGAVAVEDERGIMVFLKQLSAQRRAALAKTLLSGSGGGKPSPGQAASSRGKGKIVYRMLMDGDLMLTNRQPTLHKPGLMAHRARVLKGERTIRMHYANCSTFNADFDGDEINLHLPQDHLGRAEGYHIVHSDHQFIVPTDGKPIRGLIQDHIIAAVLITKRDTFYTRAEYQQLVYAACAMISAHQPGGADIVFLPPAIHKPRPLWTGKQIITTLLLNWTRGMPQITLRCGTKTPADYFGKENGENEVLIHKGELVTGIIDKAAFGKHGLVHGIQELYGDGVAGSILSSFSRLFTYFTQVHGFTCGIDDVLLKGSAETQRSGIIARAEGMATGASADFVKAGLAEGVTPESAKPAAVQAALSMAYRTNVTTGVMHDMKVSGTMHPLSSEVVKACLPGGQVKRFPGNCMSLMTVTGAKGSLVNFSQISCLLGQQELEGRRTPRMSSGKTLPCFAPYDGGARPGGFIGDRFLSGLRPQEFYFHCMAGRDGLVDTTVKTSRSGYLQRCLVKNLEALRVHYDGTVRDDTDASVVQLSYGEDGLDMLQTSYINDFTFLAENAQRYAQKLNLAEAVRVGRDVAHLEEEPGAEPLAAPCGDATAMACVEGVKAPKRLSKEARIYWRSAGPCQAGGSGTALPAMALRPPTYLGVTSERFATKLGEFISDNPSGLLKADKKRKKADKKGKKSRDIEPNSPLGFQQLMQLKYMTSLMCPGEAVGVLAAQSIGEPSTQMTLNTFHMAGRGEANVTMGIPRVREILMTAAKSIKTPVMKLPVLPPPPSKKKGKQAEKGAKMAKELASRLRRIRLAELLQGLKVVERPVASVQGLPSNLGRSYEVQLTVFSPDLYPQEASVTFDEIEAAFSDDFVKALRIAVKAALRKSKGGFSRQVESFQDKSGAKSGKSSEEGGGEDGGGKEGGGEEAAAAEAAAEDDEDVEEEDENQDDEDHAEGKLRWRSGRSELATYDEEGEEEGGGGGGAGAEGDAGEGLLDEEAKEEEEEVKEEEGRGAAKGGKSAKGSGDPVLEQAVSAADLTCTTVVTLPLDAPKLLMLDIAERVAAGVYVRSTSGIDKCYILGPDQPGGPAVQTDGINFTGAFEHADLVDVSQITCNCVGSMLATFGVEAARATIVQEVRAVFGAYGIAVDPRHLNLIADYMTHGGGYRAMNRVGIESCTSPLLKMSFETAAKFLMQSTLDGSLDNLSSPASRIIAGRPMQMGTGCMDLLQDFR